MRVPKPYLRLTSRAANAYYSHREEWADCTACPLHVRRSQVVLYRGRLPAPVVFFGEAPEKSEDLTGYPFTGPAGELLQDAISEAESELGDFAYAVGNVVACVPLEDGEIHPPTPVEADACSQRVKDFFHKLARPRLVFLLGLSAAKYYEYADYKSATSVLLAHPSSIIREPELKAGKSYRRFAIRIKEKIADHVKETV